MREETRGREKSQNAANHCSVFHTAFATSRDLSTVTNQETKDVFQIE